MSLSQPGSRQSDGAEPGAGRNGNCQNSIDRNSLDSHKGAVLLLGRFLKNSSKSKDVAQKGGTLFEQG
jgi:hypothetical protein